jgi:hypothetical protein
MEEERIPKGQYKSKELLTISYKKNGRRKDSKRAIQI